MSYSSTHVNEKGEVMCKTCRRKFKLNEVESCVRCDRFVCKSCATRQDGFPVCKDCRR